MSRIGFSEQPFLVYRHEDSGHPHVHIATTNIQRDGSRIDIHGIGYRFSEPARKAIEQDFGLVVAEGRKAAEDLEIKRAKYGDAPTRQVVTSIVTRVSREYLYGSFAHYKAALESLGILADQGAEGTRMLANKGLQYFILGMDGQPLGVPVKASSIASRPTMKFIEKQFEKNQSKVQEFKGSVRERLDVVLAGLPVRDKKVFAKALKKQGISIVFRETDGGRLYGMTFVCHREKVVFNGSSWGKAYTANSLNEHFNQWMMGLEPFEDHSLKMFNNE